MKKKSLLIFAVFFCYAWPGILYAQDLTKTVKVKTIYYVFKDKNLLEPEVENIKPGDFYRVQILGVNRNLWKVSINCSDTTISKKLEMPTFGNFQLEALTALIGGINPTVTSIVKTVPELSTIQQEKLNKILPNLKNYENKISVKSSVIGKKMTGYKTELNTFLTELTKIKSEIDNIQLDVYTYELNQQQENPDQSLTYDYKTALAGILKVRNEIEALQARITASQKLYLEFSKKNADDIEAVENHKLSDQEIQASYTKLLVSCSEAQTATSPDKVRDLLTGLVTVQNNAANDYVSFPMQFTKEQTKLHVEILSKNGELYKNDLTFPLKQRGYAGVGASFYCSALYNEAYSTVGTQINDSVTHYNVKKENYSKAEIGIAALMRFGAKFKNTDRFGYHGSIGPGVSISDKVKPRLLGGGGLSFGTNHMFTVDVGFIAGYVDRLSTTLIPDSTDLAIKPENVTVSKLKGSGFISFGYLYRF